MSAASHESIEDGGLKTRTSARSGAVARIARALGLGALVALGGMVVGLGVLRATNVFALIPRDGPQIWASSGCMFAEAAVRAALHATPEKPVFLIPLDQRSEVTQSACRSTLAALDHEGYRWLRYLPERWLCQRFADEATAHLDLSAQFSVPRFYAGGEHICDGLCEGAFERIGRPELHQFVTVIQRGPAGALDAQELGSGTRPDRTDAPASF
jgi:hypothetical protein